MVNAGENFCDGCGVAYHATSAHDFCQVAAWHHGWGLVIDATFEASGAPIHKLNSTLRLDSGNGSIHIFRDNITTIHHTARHVLSMTWVTLHEHGSRLEDAHGNLRHRELLVVCFFRRNDRCVTGQH